MPKLNVNQAINTLPTWDSFEAIFFVFSGLFVGFVLGIFFPSIWRTFRRRFRKESQYAPLSSSALSEDKESQSKLQILLEEEPNKINIQIAEAFILSRYYFQIGRPRDCIKIYIEILTNESVSKQETNRALFELSQVYKSINLLGRAFDTAFELLNRKPNQNKVFQYLVSLCSQPPLSQKLNSILNVYNGIPDFSLQRSVAHVLASLGEESFLKNQLPEAVDYAHQALKWDRSSGRALILLWQAASESIWQQSNPKIKPLDGKMKWVAFAAILESRGQVYLTSNTSPAAGVEYLCRIIDNLCKTENFIEFFSEVENEFHDALQWKKFSPEAEKKLFESIFYSVLLLQSRNEIRSNSILQGILSIVTSRKRNSSQINFEFSSKYMEATKIGFFAHQCEKCSAFFSTFLWQCQYCGEKESLKPVVLFD